MATRKSSAPAKSRTANKSSKPAKAVKPSKLKASPAAKSKTSNSAAPAKKPGASKKAAPAPKKVVADKKSAKAARKPALNSVAKPMKASRSAEPKKSKPAKSPQAKKSEKVAKPGKSSKVPAASKATEKAAKTAKTAKPAEVRKEPKVSDAATSTSSTAHEKAPPAAAVPAPIKRISLSKKEIEKTNPVAPPPKPPKFSPAFLKKQKERLLVLKDELLDAMSGVAKDTLRSRAEGSEGNAFGMHQADAGSDAYDRDFALSLLSQEQNSLYEIDMALKRIENGTYGICEISGKAIPQPRLEALPFTRYTVECQADLEKNNRFRARQPVTPIFNISDDDSDGDEEEPIPAESKD